MPEIIKKINLLERIPTSMMKAANIFYDKVKGAGYNFYLVGGSVRDILLKRPLADLDFATDAHPEEIMRLFPRNSVPVGIQFGTILLVFEKRGYEVTTFRNDLNYTDGRRPEIVKFSKELKEDVIRRDFTINGLAYDFRNEILYDYVGGLADLENQIIRTIGNPVERFNEDGLRPIRGFRFSATLGFDIEKNTLEAVKSCLQITARVAPERFYDEWRKTSRIVRKDIYWKLLQETGIFEIFMSSIGQISRIQLKNDFLFKILKLAKNPSMGRYAAIFFFSMYIYEETDSDQDLLEKKIKDFFAFHRFPARQERICRNILNSGFIKLTHPVDISYKDFRKIMATSDPLTVKEEIRFSINLFKVIYDMQISDKIHHLLFSYYLKLKKSREIISIAQLPVNGHDLKNIGLAGKQIGDCLKYLLYEIIEGESSKREILLARAEEYLLRQEH